MRGREYDTGYEMNSKLKTFKEKFLPEFNEFNLNCGGCCIGYLEKERGYSYKRDNFPFEGVCYSRNEDFSGEYIEAYAKFSPRDRALLQTPRQQDFNHSLLENDRSYQCNVKSMQLGEKGDTAIHFYSVLIIKADPKELLNIKLKFISATLIERYLQTQNKTNLSCTETSSGKIKGYILTIEKKSK